jgi:hypothetical protein
MQKFVEARTNMVRRHFLLKRFSLLMTPPQNAMICQFGESIRTSCIALWKRKSMRGSNLGLLRCYVAGIGYQP